MELEYLENLINFTVSTEKGFLFSQLRENAANCPNVNSQAVLFLTEQHFRSSVPKGLDLMRECFNG